jgi:hypothetical protein
VDEYVIVQTGGEVPKVMIWRHRTQQAAVDQALKASRDCNAEFVIARVVGEVKRRTEWQPSERASVREAV